MNTTTHLRLGASLAAICLLAVVPSAAQPADSAPAAWQHDLRFLRQALETTHPRPFANTDRDRWQAAADALAARLPELRPNERFVGLQRLIALLGEAHTQLTPVQPKLGLRYYPLELYLFDDGLFVRTAAPELSDLVGAKVLRLGKVSAEEALAAVAEIVAHENEWWVKAWGPLWLTIPEIVDGLGLVEDADQLPLVVELEGRRIERLIEPAGVLPEAGHRPGLPVERQSWKSMLSAEPALWQRHPDRLFWSEFLDQEEALYVSYRAVVSPPHGPSNEEQWNQVFRQVDTLNPSKLILDLRENSGGNGYFNRHVIQQILRRPAIDRPGGLYVILGRLTFSAAQQLANQLDWWTQATFVGEPTGQKPSQYGDHQTVTLPATGIQVKISTRYHQAPDSLDRRAFVPPDLFTPATSTDYARGHDPALARALDHRPTETIAERIETLVRGGELAAAKGVLETAVAAVENRFQQIEAEVNALGYRFLGARQTEMAVKVLALNAQAFPVSANVYDSLGEALLAAGKKSDAIDAYRKALAIDPEYRSAVEALERLDHP